MGVENSVRHSPSAFTCSPVGFAVIIFIVMATQFHSARTQHYELPGATGAPVA